MVAFNTIKPGDVLYQTQRMKMGNTTMTTLRTFTVRIESVDAEKRTAMVRWNGNSPVRYGERQLVKLHRTPPKKS